MKAYDLRYLMTDGVVEIDGEIYDGLFNTKYFRVKITNNRSDIIPLSKVALTEHEKNEKVVKILNSNKKSILKKIDKINAMLSEYENREKT